MASEPAVPEEESEKKQGDPPDDALGKPTGLAQDPTHQEQKRTPAEESLK